MSVYCMAKASMDMFTQCLALGGYLITLLNWLSYAQLRICNYIKSVCYEFYLLTDDMENKRDNKHMVAMLGVSQCAAYFIKLQMHRYICVN